MQNPFFTTFSFRQLPRTSSDCKLLVLPQDVGKMAAKVAAAAAGVRAELGRPGARAVQAELLVAGESGGQREQGVVLRLQVDAYDEVMSATLQASMQSTRPSCYHSSI